MSTLTVCALVFAASSFATRARAALSRSHRLSAAPDSARRCAMASPMPDTPPVTMATRPARSSLFMPPPRNPGLVLVPSALAEEQSEQHQQDDAYDPGPQRNPAPSRHQRLGRLHGC